MFFLQGLNTLQIEWQQLQISRTIELAAGITVIKQANILSATLFT